MFWKAYCSIDWTAPRFVIDASEELEKQDAGTVLAPEGHTNEVRPVSWKANSPTVTTSFMPVTVVNDAHHANAFGGMAVSPSGTWNVVAEHEHESCQPVKPAQLEGHTEPSTGGASESASAAAKRETGAWLQQSRFGRCCATNMHRIASEGASDTHCTMRASGNGLVGSRAKRHRSDVGGAGGAGGGSCGSCGGGSG